jgi:hypothetical protein
VSRHRRLQVKIRNSPARQVHRGRSRHYRRVFALLREIARQGQTQAQWSGFLPPDDGYRPWADPEYTGVLDDIRAAMPKGPDEYRIEAP